MDFKIIKSKIAILLSYVLECKMLDDFSAQLGPSYP
jgi:hypothetical protein